MKRDDEDDEEIMEIWSENLFSELIKDGAKSESRRQTLPGNRGPLDRRIGESEDGEVSSLGVSFNWKSKCKRSRILNTEVRIFPSSDDDMKQRGHF